MKKTAPVVAVAAVWFLALFVAACSTPNQSKTGSPVPTKVDFAQMVKEPARYTGKLISVQGYWFDGFEISVLAQRLGPSSFRPGNVQPEGELIWAKNGLPENVTQGLSLQPENPTGYPAHYGQVELTGLFEYGGQYGHLGAYRYQLTVRSAKLIASSQ